MFAVHEGNEPAVLDKPTLGWAKHVFVSKREAEIYAYLWAYPVSKDEAIQKAPEMDLNKQYDYGMYEVSVLMSIKEE